MDSCLTTWSTLHLMVLGHQQAKKFDLFSFKFRWMSMILWHIHWPVISSKHLTTPVDCHWYVWKAVILTDLSPQILHEWKAVTSLKWFSMYKIKQCRFPLKSRPCQLPSGLICYPGNTCGGNLVKGFGSLWSVQVMLQWDAEVKWADLGMCGVRWGCRILVFKKAMTFYRVPQVLLSWKSPYFLIWVLRCWNTH